MHDVDLFFRRIAIPPGSRSALHKKALGDDLSAALGLFFSGVYMSKVTLALTTSLFLWSLYNFARERGVANLR